jgi:hypothetical protein
MRCTVPLEQQALLHASGSCSCIRFAGGSVANSPQVLLENKLKRNLNHELPRRPGQQSGDKRARTSDAACGSSRARFHRPIMCTWTGSKSEECGNCPLHFFWSTFFTSPDGNPLIGKETESQHKRKRPWKKVKLRGSDPAFSAFSRPSQAWVAPAFGTQAVPFSPARVSEGSQLRTRGS